MASSGSGYDLYASTFSPDGRIFQVEYATKAVENAGTAIGIKCKDGVVLGVSKPLQHKMLLPKSGKRIHTVGAHAGVCMTGFVPDGRQVVNRAREEASNYKETYGSNIPPKTLGERVAYYVHYFTLHGALRPFGASTLVAAYDEDTGEHSLQMVEPSGVAHSYHACAAGKGRQPARTELEKLELHKTSSLSCEDAVKQIAKIIYTLWDESKDKPFELEMSWISDQTKWNHVGVPPATLDAAVEWAKQELEEEEDEEEEEMEE